MIEYDENSPALDFEIGMIVKMGDREYQALPCKDMEFKCTGCFGAAEDGLAVMPICHVLPPCAKIGKEKDLSDAVSGIWVDVTEVAY